MSITLLYIRSSLFKAVQRKIKNLYFSLPEHGFIEYLLKIRKEWGFFDQRIDFLQIDPRHDPLQGHIAAFILKRSKEIEIFDFLASDQNCGSRDLIYPVIPFIFSLQYKIHDPFIGLGIKTASAVKKQLLL